MIGAKQPFRVLIQRNGDSIVRPHETPDEALKSVRAALDDGDRVPGMILPHGLWLSTTVLATLANLDDRESKGALRVYIAEDEIQAGVSLVPEHASAAFLRERLVWNETVGLVAFAGADLTDRSSTFLKHLLTTASACGSRGLCWSGLYSDHNALLFELLLVLGCAAALTALVGRLSHFWNGMWVRT